MKLVARVTQDLESLNQMIQEVQDRLTQETFLQSETEKLFTSLKAFASDNYSLLLDDLFGQFQAFDSQVEVERNVVTVEKWMDHAKEIMSYLQFAKEYFDMTLDMIEITNPIRSLQVLHQMIFAVVIHDKQ